MRNLPPDFLPMTTLPSPRLPLRLAPTTTASTIGTCVECGRIVDVGYTGGEPVVLAHPSRTAPSCAGVGATPRGVLV